jgi:hypothetical protein
MWVFTHKQPDRLILAMLNLKENHQRGDHIDHVVSAYGMFKVTPGENGCHRQAKEQSGD